MTEKLKPCPFCGGTATMHHDAKEGWSYVQCERDGCNARTVGCLNDGEATRFWNRRVKTK